MWKIMEEFQDFRRRRQSKGKKRLILFFLSLSQGGGALFHFAQSFTSDTSATLWKITWRQKQLETDSFFRLVERERVSHSFFLFTRAEARRRNISMRVCISIRRRRTSWATHFQVNQNQTTRLSHHPAMQMWKNTHSSLSPRPHVVVVQVGKSLYY
jgi:hypothetical protein